MKTIICEGVELPVVRYALHFGGVRSCGLVAVTKKFYVTRDNDRSTSNFRRNGTGLSSGAFRSRQSLPNVMTPESIALCEKLAAETGTWKSGWMKIKLINNCEINYRVNTSWSYLEECISGFVEDLGLDIDPDFQRGHVWTELQQQRYVEWILRGGRSGRDLYFNCVNWQGSKKLGEFVLVDGKQRLTAVLKFVRNELPIFGGHRLRDFDDNLRLSGPDFVIHVNDLKTRAEVLQWYIDLNDGGVSHTDDEIRRVWDLLKAEKGSHGH